jgi:hypothetical protein
MTALSDSIVASGSPALTGDPGCLSQPVRRPVFMVSERTGRGIGIFIENGSS